VREKLTDSELIEKIKSGFQPAYAELINRHKNYAFTLANRILNNREEAEEAAQDAFMKVFSQINTFNNDAKFTTWFYRIVMNEALGRKRKNKIYTEDIENNISAENKNSIGEEHFLQSDQEKYIHLALKTLAEDDVKLITLFYLKELSLVEIGEILNITNETAKVKLHRARKRMALALNTLLKTEAATLY
jgi:RNA polymerase sigma factor (sigma-70 family)